MALATNAWTAQIGTFARIVSRALAQLMQVTVLSNCTNLFRSAVRVALSTITSIVMAPCAKMSRRTLLATDTSAQSVTTRISARNARHCRRIVITELIL